jgi:SAM-dependent methyltransferase
MNPAGSYEGQELELFAAAKNWKRYWSAKVRPHIRGDVLEVGAGLGTNTPYLLEAPHETWCCLEPDAMLAAQIPQAIAGLPGAAAVEVMVGTLRAVPPHRRFDTLIYIDVLEHIEGDEAEMRDAFACLNPGGKIIVLGPAHQGLFTEFDKGLGHFRRYDKASLRACTPEGAELVELYYLDSCGLLASLGNKLVLSQGVPTPAQIALWDRGMVPVSRLLDPLLGFSLGKSIVGIWVKN